jgi:hypothetical protein
VIKKKKTLGLIVDFKENTSRKKIFKIVYDSWRFRNHPDVSSSKFSE